MKVARVAFLEKIEKGYLPDEFSISISGNENDTQLIYSETFKTSEAIFNVITEIVKRDLKNSGKITTEYKDGNGTITLIDRDERPKILERIFREFLIQLGVYFGDDEIKEMLDYVKVYDVWEEQ